MSTITYMRSARAQSTICAIRSRNVSLKRPRSGSKTLHEIVRRRVGGIQGRGAGAELEQARGRRAVQQYEPALVVRDVGHSSRRVRNMQPWQHPGWARRGARRRGDSGRERSQQGAWIREKCDEEDGKRQDGARNQDATSQ